MLGLRLVPPKDGPVLATGKLTTDSWGENTLGHTFQHKTQADRSLCRLDMRVGSMEELGDEFW